MGHHSGGVHSITEKDAEMKNVSLSWMQNEALLAGLLFKESSGDWDIKDLGKKKPQSSLKHVWWALEYMPILRPSPIGSNTTTR